MQPKARSRSHGASRELNLARLRMTRAPAGTPSRPRAASRFAGVRLERERNVSTSTA